MKKIFTLCCSVLLFITVNFAFAQDEDDYHRTIVKFNGEYSERLSLFNNTIKDQLGQKVAWQTPSFMLPQLLVSINVYNVMMPIDFGFNFPVRKNFANNYKNSAKDTITINRYYQFSPGVYAKFKLGNYKTGYKPYWVAYLEGNYNIDFLGEKMEMKYDYKSFDPFNNEFDLAHGIANEFNRGIFGKRFNKTSDMSINMNGGFSTSFGIGRELNYDGGGFTWIVAATKNYFNLYDKNYVAADGSKPFQSWTQKNWLLEIKLIVRMNIFDLFTND